MQDLSLIVFAAVVIGVFVWLLRGSASDPDTVIDPNDSRTIGNLIGLMGGSVADAAMARFALERFEKAHGRPATTRDLATVAAIMREMR